MRSNDESPNVLKTETFIFCLKPGPAEECCFCLNLKIGTIVFPLIAIILQISFNITQLYLNKEPKIDVVIFVAILDILVILGYTFLIISIIYRRVDYAYYGYLIFVVKLLIILTAWTIIILYQFILLFKSSQAETNNHIKNLSIGFIIIFFIFSFEIYSLYIYYSFTRYAALDNWNAIDGDFNFTNNNDIQLNSVSNKQNMNFDLNQGSF